MNDEERAAARERRDEWKRLAEAATPGPLAIPIANVFRVIAPEARHTNGPVGATQPYPWAIVCNVGNETTGPADAAFIAAARTAVPALAAQVEALESVLREQVEKVEAENARLRDSMAYAERMCSRSVVCGSTLRAALAATEETK